MLVLTIRYRNTIKSPGNADFPRARQRKLRDALIDGETSGSFVERLFSAATYFEKSCLLQVMHEAKLPNVFRLTK
jgi:hypothetical protein